MAAMDPGRYITTANGYERQDVDPQLARAAADQQTQQQKIAASQAAEAGSHPAIDPNWKPKTGAAATGATGGSGGGGMLSSASIAPQTSSAMQGLQSVVDMSGPTTGWAEDPALSQTAGELGSTIPSQAMGVLSSMTRRGIY